MIRFKKLISAFLVFVILFTQNQEVLAETLGKVSLNINLSALSGIKLPDIKKDSDSGKQETDKKKNAYDEEIAKYLPIRDKELEILKNKEVLKNNTKRVIQPPRITEVKSFNSNTNILSWSYNNDAEYQLDIDGQAVDLQSQQGYIHVFDSKSSKHTYKVRSKHGNEYSDWSKPVEKTTELGKTIVDSKYDESITKKEKTQTFATQAVSTSQIPIDFYVHIKGEGSDIWHKGPMDFNTTKMVIDGIKINTTNLPTGSRVKYRGYFDGKGWQPWVYDGAACSMVNTPMQGVQIQLEGEATTKYSIQYMLLCADYSNAGIFGLNGTTSGYAGIDNGNTQSLTGKTCNSFNVWLINKNEYKTEIIDKDTTWSSGTYLIEGELIINQGVTLTICDGANVIFQKYKYRENGIQVKGNLIIKGTSALPVRFSYKEDGGTLSSDQYKFKGICVESTGVMKGTNAEFNSNYLKEYIINYGNINLDYCNINLLGKATDYIFDVGDSSINNCNFKNSIQDNSSVAIRIDTMAGKCASISGCTFDNIGFSSILAECVNGKIDIINNKFNKNAGEAICYSGSKTDSGIINVSGNSILSGKTGIELNSTVSPYLNISIKSNTIENCSDYGVFVGQYLGILTFQNNIITGVDAGRQKTNSGPIVIETTNLGSSCEKIIKAVNPLDSSLKNTLSGNNFDAVVLSGNITEDIKLFRGYNHYVINGNLAVSEGKTLNIEDGTTIHLRDTIYIDGNVRAEGKASSKIVFTSVNDSQYPLSHKTASNSDESKKDNNFDRIIVGDKGSFLGINAAIRYGAGDTYFSICSFGKLILLNSEVSNSASTGISATNSMDGSSKLCELTIVNCTIKDNSGQAISIGDASATIINSDIQGSSTGIYLSGSSKPSCIRGNSFKDNTYAVFADDTHNSNYYVDLRENYWGDPSGPHVYDKAGESWTGKGNQIIVINGDAVFYPYWDTPKDSVPVGDLNNYLQSVENRDEKWFGNQGVSVATGNYCKTFTDMQDCFPSFKLDFSHTYNSKDNTVSLLGSGWRLSFQGEISDFKSSSGKDMKKVILPSGETQTFSINSDGTYTANDSRNTLAKVENVFVLTNKEQMQYLFNSSGKLYCIKDKNANTLNIEYINGKIDRVYDETNKSFKFTYDSATGYVDKITESFGTTVGRVLNFDYDANNRLSSVTDALGNVTNYFYNSSGLLQDIKDDLGNLIEQVMYTSYNSEYLVLNKIDSYGNKLTYQYDSSTSRTIVTDSNGWAKEYWYDAYGYTTVVINQDRTIQATEYYLDTKTNENKYGEEKSVTDINGNKTSYERDSRGNVTTITNPDNTKKLIGYDEKNNVIKQTDELGNITYYVFDNDKINLISKVQPLNGKDTLELCLEYPSKAATTSYEHYSEAERVQNGYKIKGLIKSEKDAMGNYVKYKYDSNGNKLYVTDKLQKDTSYTYDSYNHLATMTTPENFKTSYIYDINGNLEKTTLQGGEVTRTVYDKKGQKIQEVQANLYNSSCDKLDEHAYTGMHGVRNVYYPNGKLKTITDVMDNTTEYTYDYYGNIKTEKKPNGALYTHFYDCQNRLLKTTFKESATSKAEITLEEFSYNINANSTTTGGKRVDKIQRQYTDNSNYITTVSTYDYANRLVNVINADGTEVTTNYLENGLKLSVKSEDGSMSYYGYDGMNRLVKQWVASDNTTDTKLYTFSGYDYDANGNKIKEWTGITPIAKENSVKSTDSNIISVSYDYYPDGKLKQKLDNENRREEYQYDDDRVLTQKTVYMDTQGNTQVIKYQNNYFGKPNKMQVAVMKKDINGNVMTDATVSDIWTNNVYDKYGNIVTNYFGKPNKMQPAVIKKDNSDNVMTDTTVSYIWTSYVYDKDGNVVTEKNYGIVDSADITDTTPVLNSISTAYDNADRVIKVTKQAQGSDGNPSTISTSKNYTWDGKVSETVDGNGKKTSNKYDLRGRLVTIIDAKGQGNSYTYDYIGRVLTESTPKDSEDYSKIINSVNQYYNATPGKPNWNSVYDVNKDNIIDIFDLVAISKASPNKTSYEYDCMGRVIRQIKTVRDISTLEWKNTVVKAYKYDSKGNIIKELDAGGYAKGTSTSDKVTDIINSGYGKEYTYTPAGKINTILYPVSKESGKTYTYKYEYDALGRNIKEYNINGSAFTYAYNNSGLVLQKNLIKYDGTTAILEQNIYNLTDNLISRKDGNGNETQYEYNQLGKIRKITTPSDASIASNVTQYQYDIYGNQVFQTDSTGKKNVILYDNSRRKIYEKSSKADGTQAIEKRYRYDANNNVISFVDGNNNETLVNYDELNRPKTKSIIVSYVDGSKKQIKTDYEYDGVGNVTKETDWLGNAIKYSYDVFGRLVEKRDAYDKIIEKLTYNLNGTQSASYDAYNNGTGFEYDDNNRLIKTTKGITNASQNSVKQVTQQRYDDLGNIIKKIDGKEHETQYQYNELNKVIYVTNPLSETTSYTYDNNGNMLSMIDGNGSKTIFHYNCMNKLDNVNWPACQKSVMDITFNKAIDLSTVDLSESYTYDAEGNLSSKVDRNKNKTTYTYDVHGRKLTEVVGDISYSYTYDNNNNPLNITNVTGTTTRTYDSLNRVTTKTVPGVGKTTYLYDNTEGRPQGCYAELSTDPKGFVTTKVYDKAKRLNQVTESGKTTNYSYWDNGNTQQVVYPNGSKEEYTYNNVNSLEKLVNYNKDGVVLGKPYTYFYDECGNIVKKSDNKGDTSYGYDLINRLSTVTESGKTTSYTFDKAGNRTSVKVDTPANTALGITASTKLVCYYYDTTNKLKYSSQLDSSAGAANKAENIYTYDNNGNQLTVTENSYNAYNLIQTTKLAKNKYDNLNQLIETVTKDGVVVNNVYNAEGYRIKKTVNGSTTNYMYEGDKPVLEFDEAGNVTARNIYGSNLISRTKNGDKEYYLYNGHSDVTNLLNEAGEVKGTYYYDAFGNPTENNSSLDNPFLYAGYQFDKETGMYYLNARMYDPVTARFMQEDTYRGNPDDPLSLNQYTYCNNNPLIYDDPTGHWLHIAIGAIVGAAIGVGANAISDYMDDGKFNSGRMSYAGAALEGLITGAAGAATMGSSLLFEAAVMGVASFGVNAASQYISKGHVDWKEAAYTGAFGAVSTVGGHYAAKFISKLPVVESLASRTERLMNVAKERSKKLGEDVMSRASQKMQALSESLQKFADNMNPYKLAFANDIRSELNRPIDFTGTINDPKIRVKFSEMNNSLSKEIGSKNSLKGAADPITKSEYSSLRKKTPSNDIRKMVNPEGTKIDPVYGYATNVLEADHIVPMKEIVDMPGFTQLSREQQIEVLNLQDNFIGLGKSTNASKGTKNWTDWQGHSKLGEVPSDVRSNMLELESSARTALQKAIEERLKK